MLSFNIYTRWGLLVPIGLSLFYGITRHRAKAVLGYIQKNTVWAWIREILPLCSCSRFGE